MSHFISHWHITVLADTLNSMAQLKQIWRIIYQCIMYKFHYSRDDKGPDVSSSPWGHTDAYRLPNHIACCEIVSALLIDYMMK